jgi:O-antigen ligase
MAAANPLASDGASTRRLSSLGIAVAALAVGLPPLVFLSSLKDPFRLPKLLASESLALISLVLLSAAIVSSSRRAVGAAALARRSSSWAALAVLAIATLGLATSSHPAHVREALPSLWIAVAATVGWSLGMPSSASRRLLDLLLVPGAILAAVAILQFHDLYQPFAFDPRQIDPRTRITSLAGNVGDLAAYLVLPLLVGQVRVWEALRRREPEQRRRPASSTRASRASRPRLGLAPGAVAAGAGAALALYALAVTMTLTALVAVALATLVLWLVLIERRRTFLLAAGALAVSAAVLTLAGPLRPRAVEKLDELRRGEINNVLTGRLDGWRAGLLMMRRHPSAGVGHGAFVAEFAPAKLELLARGVPFFERQLTSIFSSAHNEAIEVGAEWGVPGLLAFLGASVALMRSARRVVMGAGSGSRGDAALAAAGLVSFGALAMASVPFRIALTGYQAVVFAAWVLAAGERAPASATSDGARSRAPDRGTPRQRRLAYAALAAAVVAATAAALHARSALGQIATSAKLQRIESETALMIRANRPVPAVLQANRRALLDLRQHDPSEPAIPLALGTQLFLLERYPEAIDWYQRALDLEPHPEAYFSRGLAELRLGDRRAARESFALAVELSPFLADEVPADARDAARPGG